MQSIILMNFWFTSVTWPILIKSTKSGPVLCNFNSEQKKNLTINMILFCFIDRYNYDNNGTEKTSRHSLPKNKKKKC